MTRNSFPLVLLLGLGLGCESPDARLIPELREFITRSREGRTSHALADKFLSLSDQRYIRTVHSSLKLNPVVGGVSVRAEERRISGSETTFTELTSINPLTHVHTEDVRHDSAIVIEFATDSAERAIDLFRTSISVLRKVEEGVPPNADEWNAMMRDLEAGRALLDDLAMSGRIREIRVEAYHRRRGAKERTRVHVHNYDDISQSDGDKAASAATAVSPSYTIPVPRLAREIADACVKQLLGLLLVIPKEIWEKGRPLAGEQERFNQLIDKIRMHAQPGSKPPENPTAGTPPSAMVLLKNQAVEHDDELLIKVFVVDRQPKTDKSPARVASYVVDYHIRLVMVGLMNSTRGSFIYARGNTGEGHAKDWKPNAAALTEWHYRPAYAKTGLEKFWSWLDPGAGIHVASLDMDPDLSTEVGVGVNVSLWGGLLQAGYGTNLLVDRNHEYFFIGLDLFKLLQPERDKEFPIR